MKILIIVAVAASAASFAGPNVVGRSAAHQNSAYQFAGNSSVLPSQRPAYLAANASGPAHWTNCPYCLNT